MVGVPIILGCHIFLDFSLGCPTNPYGVRLKISNLSSGKNYKLYVKIKSNFAQTKMREIKTMNPPLVLNSVTQTATKQVLYLPLVGTASGTNYVDFVIQSQCDNVTIDSIALVIDSTIMSYVTTTLTDRSVKDKYKFGFNGQMKDNEIKGVGNSIDYKYRMHDPRLGRFFAVDPLAQDYPWNSSYAFCENRVIDGIELEGREFTFFGQMPPWLATMSRVGLMESNKIMPNNPVESLPLEQIIKNSSSFSKEQLANFSRGRNVEAEQLLKNGLEKNTKPIDVEVKPGQFTRTVPDATKNGGQSTVEIKNVKSQSLTRQLKAQEKFSNGNGLKPELIINNGARLSKPLQNSSFDIKTYQILPPAQKDNLSAPKPLKIIAPPARPLSETCPECS